MTPLRRIGIGGRQGGAVALGLIVATILGLGAAVFCGKQNSDMEKDALRRTQEVAGNSRAPKASQAAQEALPQQTKQLQYDETKRMLSVITPGGGPLTDLVDFADQADEASRFYGQLLFGNHATNAQLAIAAQRAAAAKTLIGRTNPNLAGNRALVGSLLRKAQTAQEQMSNPATIANLREKFPDTYGNLQDDAQVREKYLKTQWSGAILNANSAYAYAKQELRHEGADPSPAQVNAVVSTLFAGSDSGDNKKAFHAAVAEVKARQNAYGTYQGSFSGSAWGTCQIVVSRSGVKASFTGKGRTGQTGSFTVKVSGTGPYDPQDGSFSGKLDGSLTWVLPEVPLMGTSAVTGSYRGSVGGQGVTGTWKATASEETRSGDFKAGK